MKLPLIFVILTYNEAAHIERAIQNIRDIANKILVLDSYSTDDTAEKARALGAEIIYRKFDNYKNQREYAIEYVKDLAEWVFFLDADEYLTTELKNEIKNALNQPDVHGFYLPRRFIFMNRWIKWGGYYPTYLLRLFRPQHASLHGIINEHVKVSGKTTYLQHDFVDHNLKGMSNWIEKHNRYASLEAQELMNFKKNKPVVKAKLFATQAERKQWLRYKIWNNLPIVIRPFLYFTYRYFFRLGFLDGKEGLIYHFLQGFWLWFLVDVKYSELKKNN